MKKTVALLACLLAGALITGCKGGAPAPQPPVSVPPDDSIVEPVEQEKTPLEKIKEALGTLPEGEACESAQELKENTVTDAGDYLVTGAHEGKLTVAAENVHLYFSDATLTAQGCVIESGYDVIITLIGENTLTSAAGASVIFCSGRLIINGTGTLAINNAVGGGLVARTLAQKNAELTVTVKGCGMESTAENKEAFYQSGIYLESAKLTVRAENALRSHTYCCIAGESTLDVTADGTGLSAALMLFTGGAVTVNATGGIVSQQTEVTGGRLSLTTSGCAVTAKELTVTNGTLNINRSQKGICGEDIALEGGTVTVTSIEAGVEAAKVKVADGGFTVTAEETGVAASLEMRVSGGLALVSAKCALRAGAVYTDGGYLFALGEERTENVKAESLQYAVSYLHSRTIYKDTVVSVTDDNKNRLFYYMCPQNCKSVLVSCPELKRETYYFLLADDIVLKTVYTAEKITQLE